MNPLSRKTFCQSRVLLAYEMLTNWSDKLTFFFSFGLKRRHVVALFCAHNQDCLYIHWCYLHVFSCSVHSISTDTVHKCRGELGKICTKKIQSNTFYKGRKEKSTKTEFPMGLQVLMTVYLSRSTELPNYLIRCRTIVSGKEVWDGRKCKSNEWKDKHNN